MKLWKVSRLHYDTENTYFGETVKRLALPTLMIAGFALAGCAGHGPASVEVSATPSSDPQASTDSQASGTTLDQLRNLYARAGGECITLIPRDTKQGADETAYCDGGAILSTYASEAQVADAVALLGSIAGTPYEIAVGSDWTVHAKDAGILALEMGGRAVQIGEADRITTPTAESFDLATDEGLCSADSKMTDLELNDAVAPLFGFPAERRSRTYEETEKIRAYKNAAFSRECPERVS